jgi:hypothetical protein
LGFGFEDESNYAPITELPRDQLFSWCRKDEPKRPAIIADFTPVFSEKSSSSEWHPLIRQLIDEFGHYQEVLNEVASNIMFFSSWGSRVSYYDRRLTMMKQLSTHPKNEVKDWASRLAKTLESEHREAAIEAEEWDWGIH